MNASHYQHLYHFLRIWLNSFYQLPLSCRNKEFQDALLIRPHVLLLNKIDLGDRNQVYRAKKVLMDQGVQHVLLTNFSKGGEKVIKHKVRIFFPSRVVFFSAYSPSCIYRYFFPNFLTQILPAAIEVLENSPRYHRAEVSFASSIIFLPFSWDLCICISYGGFHFKVDHYNMLVIGLPNVGKSTLINSWRQSQLGKGKSQSSYQLYKTVSCEFNI